MYGHALADLTSHYRAIRRELGLDLLLVQETDPRTTRKIARSLGKGYRSRTSRGLGVIFDHTKLRHLGSQTVSLPSAQKLNIVEKLYIRLGDPEPRFAHISVFESASGRQIKVVNFHLDAGTNRQLRRDQMQALVQYLERDRSVDRVIVAGDTNAFALRNQLGELRRLMKPLEHIGARDEGTHPTHSFADGIEPGAAKRLVRAGARLLGDPGRRYDVIAVSDALRPSRSYLWDTGDGSDHGVVLRFVEP